jgi:hypothetical protein
MAAYADVDQFQEQLDLRSGLRLANRNKSMPFSWSETALLRNHRLMSMAVF